MRHSETDLRHKTCFILYYITLALTRAFHTCVNGEIAIIGKRSRRLPPPPDFPNYRVFLTDSASIQDHFWSGYAIICTLHFLPTVPFRPNIQLLFVSDIGLPPTLSNFLLIQRSKIMVSPFRHPGGGYLLVVLFLTNYLTEYAEATDSTTLPETTSLQGTLQGVNLVTHHNRSIYGFKAIPFAEPPVGDLRFKAPVPAGSWNGTFNASSDSKLCPQVGSSGVSGDEDCLYLHVYTPQLPTSNNSSLLPVMVFLYGGGFKTGSMNPVVYGPDFLLDQDVLLVVPNFRLGVLGYLTTGDEASPGNYGLKDIVLALEWVRDNIQYFGGDPNQVTLCGGSSGAMSVHLLTLSDLTEGLFHKYITESGVALAWMSRTPTSVHVNNTIQLAEYFGCPTNTSTLLVNCLRGINASELIDTQSLFYVWQSIPDHIWFPTVEPDIEGALLTDTPANLIAAGKIRSSPWLNLVVRDDGLVTTMKFHEDAELFEGFLENIDEVLPLLLDSLYGVNNLTAFTEALKSYYLNDLTADRTLLLKNLTMLVSDGQFHYPAYESLQQQLAFAKSPEYFCSFEYRGVFSYTYLYSGGSTNYTDVAHGDEIIYLFENTNYRFGPPSYKYSEADWSMVDKMVQLWTSFATTGTPTIADSDIIWEPYSLRNNYLQIGNQSDTAIEVKYDLHKERMNFWKELMAASIASTSAD